MTEPAKGTYVSVKFSQKTITQLTAMVNALNVPSPVSPDEYHCTLIYSEKGDPTIQGLGMLDTIVIATPNKFNVFEQRDGLQCLVLEIDSPSLHMRHRQLLDGYDVEHSFPDYKAHVTLSYDCGPAHRYKHVDPWKYIAQLEIVEERVEELDVDWKPQS